MPKSPLWRKLEAALIDLLREEGFVLWQDRGNTFIEIGVGNQVNEICIGDFAKELEERL